jgi:PhoD-like phosphatase
MSTPRRRRLTRATLFAGVLAGAAAVPAILRGGLGGGPSKKHDSGFASLPDAKGWPKPWLAQHYLRDLRVRGGQGLFTLPAGLDTSAPAQPMPIFLVDRACGGATHALDFSVTNPTLRPGILFAAQSDVDYLAVTCERTGLVLARYGRGGREVIAEGPHPALVAATPYHLRVAVHSGTVRAKVWKASRPEPPVWHLTGRPPGSVDGTPGLIVVHPRNFAAATLAVSAHTITAEAAFRPTPPVACAEIAGVPLRRPDGGYDVRLRAISAFPAKVTFHTRTPAGAAAAAYEASQPPYTALHLLRLEPGERLDWHAELESHTSGVRTDSPPQEVIAPHGDERLVMLAASCEQFSGEPPSRAYAAMVEAAQVRPAALVFQGDLGYANNSFHSCYISAPDFFADRFRRTLAGQDFADLRARIPTGVTIDDHDYGPQNNADRTTYAHWAPPLWARIHADPDPTGYFDFRFGDVHSLTLDVRRYADPVLDPNTPAKTRIGERQFAWMQHILETSDAKLFVIFSAGIFASRYHVTDCWLTGYPNEYDRAMKLFLDVQARGPRVLILSGDAHGLRIHHHPYPQRVAPRGASVIEFICSGIRARMWSGAQLPDPTLDKRRNVLFRYGGGLIDIDPPATPQRQITLRAISGNIGRPGDLFPPLVLPFRPV